MSQSKKKILFIGAGGMLASRIIPSLAEQYDIVGIGGRRDDLKTHCVQFLSGNLLQEHRQLFETAFAAHAFDAVVWNPVRYFLRPLMESSRETLHTEFDLAIALPVECLRLFLAQESAEPVFILVSSLSAFHYNPKLASYGVIKNAQIKLAEVASAELGDRVHMKVVAPGSVPGIETKSLVEAFHKAIENSEPAQMIYKVAN